MATKTGRAVWKGTLKEGSGTFSLQTGLYTGPYTFASRFGDDGSKTNPEELIGAAHASCFAMFLSSVLEKNGTPAGKLSASSAVTLGDGPTITKIELSVNAQVSGVENEKFQELAKEAKENCPVSKALAAVHEMTLNAKLV